MMVEIKGLKREYQLETSKVHSIVMYNVLEHPIQGGQQIFLVASRYGNQRKALALIGLSIRPISIGIVPLPLNQLYLPLFRLRPLSFSF